MDDYLLLVAWAASLANAIFWQLKAPELYLGIALGTGKVTEIPKNFGTQMNHYLESLLAIYIVQYIGLWCVKLSLLFFFRGLGKGIKRQRIIWWCTCAFIAASFVICIATINYNCLTSSYPENMSMYTVLTTTRLLEDMFAHISQHYAIANRRTNMSTPPSDSLLLLMF